MIIYILIILYNTHSEVLNIISQGSFNIFLNLKHVYSMLIKYESIIKRSDFYKLFFSYFMPFILIIKIKICSNSIVIILYISIKLIVIKNASNFFEILFVLFIHHILVYHFTRKTIPIPIYCPKSIFYFYFLLF